MRLMNFNSSECRLGAEVELTVHNGTVRDLIFMEGLCSPHGPILVSGGAGDCHIYLTGILIVL